jgi:hypothetical protein
MEKTVSMAEWRKGRAYQMLISDGLAIRARRLTVIDLVNAGDLPADSIKGFDAFNERMNAGAATIDDVLEVLPLVNQVIKAIVVDPPIADLPDDEHLGIEEILVADRMALFNWANTGEARLEPVRQEAD